MHVDVLATIRFREPRQWDVFSQQQKDELIKEYGTEKDAANTVDKFELAGNIIHELAHTLQDPSIPYYFAELGAYYYQHHGATNY